MANSPAKDYDTLLAAYAELERRARELAEKWRAEAVTFERLAQQHGEGEEWAGAEARSYLYEECADALAELLERNES